LAPPATNGVFVKSTGVIVILWNINGVKVSFSHEWGEIVKQGKFTGVTEILKGNRWFWVSPNLTCPVSMFMLVPLLLKVTTVCHS
jgi:hypothetical protein